MTALSWNDVLEIEQELNGIKFDGVPLGSLLCYELRMATRQKQKSGIINLIKINVRILQRKYFPKIVNLDSIKGHIKNKNIFNVTGRSERLTGLMTPVLEYLNAENIVFLGKNIGNVPIGGVVTISVPPGMSRENFESWMRNFRTIESEIRVKIKELANRFRISFLLSKELYYYCVDQTQSLEICKNLFENNNVKCLITDHDRQKMNVCLVFAAQKFKIPNLTYIHGNTYPNAEGFYPLIADKLLCWGQKHFEQFSKLGIEKSRLILTGNPKLNRTKIGNREEIKKRLGIATDLKTVVFATNKIKLANRQKLVSDFTDFMSGLDMYQGVIKLHPVETKEDYEPLSSDTRRKVIFCDKNELSFEESLAIADVVVNHSSAFGLEALVKKIPVIVLNTVDEDLYVGKELIEEAKCPNVTNKEQFEAAIKKTFTVEQDEFVTSYYCAFGDESAKIIAEYVEHQEKNQ